MKQIAGWVIIVGLMAAMTFGWSNRYNLRDQLYLRNYTPTSQIATIASDVQFTDYGERLFYVHNPLVLQSDAFNVACPDSESSIVLGCFDGANIYIYDVTDEALNGVEEVTAAHEMLHAAYARLSKSERSDLNPLLEAVESSLTDERIRSVLDTYHGLNYEDMMNEYHSIFATEVDLLPQPLEEYYSKYFKDRSSIVAISNDYEKVFTDLENAVAEFDTQLSVLRFRIEGLEKEATELTQEIQKQEATLQSYLASGNNQKYNQGVAPYNKLVSTYNNLVSKIKDLIIEHNSIIEERNRLSSKQGQLIKSIDSNLEEIR